MDCRRLAGYGVDVPGLLQTSRRICRHFRPRHATSGRHCTGVFITLWEKRKKKDLQSSSLSSFLLVSVRNRCYHRLEKKDILRHTLDLKEVNVAFEEYNEKHDHIITRILSEIEKLPPRSQEIMLAVFVDGLKYREVAEKYHISLSTVKTLLGNAVRKLKKELGAEGLSIFLFFFRIKK